jgi:hypothetical protein
MIINNFMAVCAPENGKEVVAFRGGSFHLRRQMAKDRRVGIVVADAGDLEGARLSPCAIPKLG